MYVNIYTHQPTPNTDGIWVCVYNVHMGMHDKNTHAHHIYIMCDSVHISIYSFRTLNVVGFVYSMLLVLRCVHIRCIRLCFLHSYSLFLFDPNHHLTVRPMYDHNWNSNKTQMCAFHMFMFHNLFVNFNFYSFRFLQHHQKDQKENRIWIERRTYSKINLF